MLAKGSFLATLHFPELRWAINRGHVRSVERAWLYQTGRPLVRVMEELCIARKAEKKAGREWTEGVLKGMANGMIGKFGQRPGRWIDSPWERAALQWGTWGNYDFDSGVSRFYRSLGGRVQWLRPEGMASHDHYLTELERAAISAEEAEVTEDTVLCLPGGVTSWGRAILGSIIDRLPFHSVYYCDTDCVHLSQDGWDAFQSLDIAIGEDMGQWRLETVAREAEYWAPKMYRLEERMVAAGLPRGAEPVGGAKFRAMVRRGWTALAYAGPGGLLEHVPVTFDPKIDPGLDVDQDGWVEAPTLTALDH